MDGSLLNLDLRLAADADLRAAVEAIREVRATRARVPPGKIAHHLRHIALEVQADGATDDPVQLSIEHLELYRNYLLRLHPSALEAATAEARDSRSTLLDAKSALNGVGNCTDSKNSKTVNGMQGGGEGSLAEQHERLLTLVLKKLEQHPLASRARSGDVSAAAASAGSATQRRKRVAASIIKTPLRRRRQMMAMLFLNFFTGPSLIFFTLALFWWLVPWSNYIFAAYFAFVMLDGALWRQLPSAPARCWRNSGIFRLFRNYFPIRLLKSTAARTGGAEMFSRAKNFLFCYHPHGVQSAGAFMMASHASGFDELFPGLRVSVQTLSINFKVPVFRENCMMLGMGDASKGCLMRALSSAHPGGSAVLVTGGARESMLAHPYTSKVVLKDRAGFVKVAIRSGASLVPVWGFGENNLYENMAVGHPWIQKWQRRIQRVLTFAPLMVQGRGVFSYSSGLVPHRRPISVVVGTPIDVGPADPQPSREKVQKIHTRYKKAVLELFEQYRDIYDPKAQDIEMV